MVWRDDVRLAAELPSGLRAPAELELASIISVASTSSSGLLRRCLLGTCQLGVHCPGAAPVIPRLLAAALLAVAEIAPGLDGLEDCVAGPN